MGFSYGFNSLTGRKCLSCDFCGESNGRTVKMRCPYGYCQAWAVCRKAECREKARGSSSVGIVHADGSPDREAGKMHAHCKRAMDQAAKEKAALEAGGLHVKIASGNWHAAETVHGLFYVIEPHSYQWSSVLGRGAWYEKEELISKLEALGHTVEIVSDEEAERIVHGQRSGFYLSDGSDALSKPIEEAFASL